MKLDMKKILHFSFLILLSLSSCYENKEANNSPKTEKEKRIPKYMSALKYKYNFGIQDTIGILSEEQKFDSIGNKIEHIIYSRGTIYLKYFYRYDSLNRLIEELTFGTDGNLKLKTKILYDVTGRKKTELSTAGEDLDYTDKIVYKNKEIKYEYNSLGVLVSKVEIEMGGKKIITEYEYDSKSRLVHTYEVTSGKKNLTENIFYNGNEREETIYSSFDVWEWNYNSEGDSIKIIAYDKKGKIKFKRIDILDDAKRHIRMEGYNTLAEPTFINRYYYEYY